VKAIYLKPALQVSKCIPLCLAYAKVKENLPLEKIWEESYITDIMTIETRQRQSMNGVTRFTQDKQDWVFPYPGRNLSSLHDKTWGRYHLLDHVGMMRVLTK
jgi:hypothetical protein